MEVGAIIIWTLTWQFGPVDSVIPYKGEMKFRSDTECIEYATIHLQGEDVRWQCTGKPE